MKKRLEAELISIAHRVLKLKNKSEVDQLYLETKKLYETLAVLKFYSDNYENLKSEISNADLEVKLTASFEQKTPEKKRVIPEEVIPFTEEPIIETMPETVKIVEKELVSEIANEEEEGLPEPIFEAINFEPIFELATESPMEDEIVEEKLKKEVVESLNKTKTQQISFEDLLGDNYSEPVFVKSNDVVVPPSLKNSSDEKLISLNDQHSKTINFGMNDRIAFVKHLFADSTEDFNRVISQLSTLSSAVEATNFIDEIIKPDYNNWIGSEEYAERFLDIVAKKFN
jgi:hypothetical protein